MSGKRISREKLTIKKIEAITASIKFHLKTNKTKSTDYCVSTTAMVAMFTISRTEHSIGTT